MYGKHHSEESKRKISLAHVGKKGLLGEKNPMYGKHQSEEMKKKLSKALAGENGANAKLTWKQVNEIRNLYSTGNYSYRQLGVMFNIYLTTIAKIVKNAIWKV